jgi:hypothetical protein
VRATVRPRSSSRSRAVSCRRAARPDARASRRSTNQTVVAGQLALRQPFAGHDDALTRDNAPVDGRGRNDSEPRLGNVVGVDGDPALGAVVTGDGLVIGVDGAVVTGELGCVVTVLPPPLPPPPVPPPAGAVVTGLFEGGAVVVVAVLPPDPPPDPPPEVGATKVKACASVSVWFVVVRNFTDTSTTPPTFTAGDRT